MAPLEKATFGELVEVSSHAMQTKVDLDSLGGIHLLQGLARLMVKPSKPPDHFLIWDVKCDKSISGTISRVSCQEVGVRAGIFRVDEQLSRYRFSDAFSTSAHVCDHETSNKIEESRRQLQGECVAGTAVLAGRVAVPLAR